MGSIPDARKIGSQIQRNFLSDVEGKKKAATDKPHLFEQISCDILLQELLL